MSAVAFNGGIVLLVVLLGTGETALVLLEIGVLESPGVPFAEVVTDACMMFISTFVTPVLQIALGHSVMSPTIITKLLLLDDLTQDGTSLCTSQLRAMWLPLQNTQVSLLLASLFPCGLPCNEV